MKVVSIGDEEVTLRWEKPKEDTIKEIGVYRSDDAGKTWKRIATVPKEQTEYTDDAAPNGVEVTYQLTSRTDAAESEKSIPVRATANADQKLQQRLKEAEKAYKTEDIALAERISEPIFWNSHRADFQDAFAHVDHEIWAPEIQEIRYQDKTAVMSGQLARSLTWAEMEIQTSHQETLRQFNLLKSNDGIWHFTALDEDFPRKALEGGPMATASTGNTSSLDAPILPNSLVLLVIWTQDARAFINTTRASATGPDGKAIRLVFVDGGFGGFFLAPNQIGEHKLIINATSRGQENYAFEHVFRVTAAEEQLPAAPQMAKLPGRETLRYLTKQVRQQISQALK